MRNFCIRHICLLLIVLIFCATCPAYAAEGDIGIALNFDKTEYKTGDTATATLSLTGLSGLDKSDKLGSFQAYIKYNVEDVVPMYSGAEVEAYGQTAGEFDAAIKTDIEKSGADSGFATATKQIGYLNKDERIIVVYFQTPDGIAVSGDTLTIGTIQFKIKKTAGTVCVSFYEGAYAAYRPYTGTGGSEEVEGLPFNIISAKDASAKIKTDAQISPSEAIYSEEDKKVTADVTVITNASATLLAQLYDKTTGLTKGVKINKITYAEGEEYKYQVTFDNISSTENLCIRYFLWTTTSAMTPVCINKISEIN